MKIIAQAATVLTIAAGAALGLAAPASAGSGSVPHLDHDSSAHCLGWAISIGAVTGGPGAVADHQAAVREELGRDYGPVTAMVAKLPSCF